MDAPSARTSTPPHPPRALRQSPLAPQACISRSIKGMATTDLDYAVYMAPPKVAVSDNLPPGEHRRMWSPTASTRICPGAGVAFGCTTDGPPTLMLDRASACPVPSGAGAPARGDRWTDRQAAPIVGQLGSRGAHRHGGHPACGSCRPAPPAWYRAPEHWRNQRGHPPRTIAWAISGPIGLGVAMVTAGSSSSPPCSTRWHQAAVGALAARAEPTRTTTMLKEENR